MRHQRAGQMVLVPFRSLSLMADTKHPAGRSKAQPRSSPSRSAALDYADSEPLSLAEELAEEADRLGEDSDARYERIKHNGDIHIAELQRMTMPQLIEQARTANVSDCNGLKKQELI